METNDETLTAFFCVPDITGFTKFITSADINFSRSFISGIMARMVKANVLKLEVAEIEGDAIFFYKTGRLPAFKQVGKQCDLLFSEFYKYLNEMKAKEEENYNQYFADGQLGLKIIIHYGEVLKTRIQGRVKLIGEDVIIAHKLLKNCIEEGEYILLTEAYLKKVKSKESDSVFEWNNLKACKETYDHIGDVKYSYIPVDVSKYYHS